MARQHTLITGTPTSVPVQGSWTYWLNIRANRIPTDAYFGWATCADHHVKHRCFRAMGTTKAADMCRALVAQWQVIRSIQVSWGGHDLDRMRRNLDMFEYMPGMCRTVAGRCKTCLAHVCDVACVENAPMGKTAQMSRASRTADGRPTAPLPPRSSSACVLAKASYLFMRCSTWKLCVSMCLILLVGR